MSKLRRSNAALAAALLNCVLFAPSTSAQVAPNGPAPVAAASANINITPRRVIFDPAKRSDAVYVFNQGTTAVMVDVALVDNVMLKSGEIVPVARAAEKGEQAVAGAALVKSAKPFLLAAPSRIILPPGQGRTVRLRATAPGGEPAEYRTHLTVSTVPPPDTGLTAEQASAVQRGELVLRINSIFGVSIPVIVRTGGVAATAAFGAMNLAEEKGAPALEVALRRSGSGSLYGNIEVRAAKNEVVGQVRGLGVYTEIDERTTRIPLNRRLRQGETVSVSFFGDDSRPGSALANGTYTAP